MNLKTFTLAIIYTLLTPSLLYASIEEKAEKLLIISETEAAMKQAMDQVLTVQIQQNPTLAPFKKTMIKFLHKHMSFESLKGELISIYTGYFNEKEMDDLIAFYESDTGKKSIQVMPGIMKQSGELGIKRVSENITELQEMIKAESERLTALQNQ